MKVTLLVNRFQESDNQGCVKVAYNIAKYLGSQVKLDVIYDNRIDSFWKNLVYDIFVLPMRLMGKKSDVFHALAPEESIAPLCLHKKPLVTTIHDMILFEFPERRFVPREYYKFAAKIAKYSDQIVTVSHFSKKKINKYLGVDYEKILVIYNGVDHEKYRPIKTQKDKLIGYLGGLGRRKNIETLIKAFYILKNSYNIKHKLVIGGTGAEELNLKKMVSELKLGRDVKFLGYIPEESLPAFYNSLDVFVFPSLYEGFGLPVLEAMACGVPVVVSNTSSLPEIVGDAGILIDPTSPGDLAQKIYEVLSDPSLHNKLCKKVVKRAQEFSWEKTAAAYLDIYKEVVG